MANSLCTFLIKV